MVAKFKMAAKLITLNQNLKCKYFSIFRIFMELFIFSIKTKRQIYSKWWDFGQNLLRVVNLFLTKANLKKKSYS
jgi:hypothetical protein